MLSGIDNLVAEKQATLDDASFTTLIRTASADTWNSFLSRINSSIVTTASSSDGNEPTGIVSSAAPTLQSSSSCQFPCSHFSLLRFRTSSAQSGKNVCANSCAIEKLTLPRGLCGLYSISNPPPAQNTRASASAAFGRTEIPMRFANSIGSNGGPRHPSSTASRTTCRASCSIFSIGSAPPAESTTDASVQPVLLSTIPIRLQAALSPDHPCSSRSNHPEPAQPPNFLVHPPSGYCPDAEFNSRMASAFTRFGVPLWRALPRHLRRKQ